LATVHVHDSYAELDPGEWDELVGQSSPFLESAFLFGLEQTGCATAATGWHPRPVLVRDDRGRLVAAAPGWVKDHSMGEFVYDHGWARAAMEHGIRYYPKFVVAVPFTPVTGSRLLVRPGEERAQWIPSLVHGLASAARDTEGLHILFDTASEAQEMERHGAFSRLQFQFHWQNRDYADYDAFLADLRSTARKKMRRERREVGDLRFERVFGPDPGQMDLLYRFYASTCDKYPWGQQYLNRAFFRHLASHWAHRVVGVFARRGDRLIAGALDVLKGDRLYGRYWGCDEEVKFLHFEVCYHQGIELCIERGLSVFEPGHGGEHKYRRGFVPVLTWSSHWLADQRLELGLSSYCRREAHAVRAHAEALREAAPFKER